jgi:hypothetical protein
MYAYRFYRRFGRCSEISININQITVYRISKGNSRLRDNPLQNLSCQFVPKFLGIHNEYRCLDTRSNGPGGRSLHYQEIEIRSDLSEQELGSDI